MVWMGDAVIITYTMRTTVIDILRTLYVHCTCKEPRPSHWPIYAEYAKPIISQKEAAIEPFLQIVTPYDAARVYHIIIPQSL